VLAAAAFIGIALVKGRWRANWNTAARI